MNLDDLLAALRRIGSAVDGPPDSVLEAARAAFLTRDIDAEVAVLVADSRFPDGDPLHEPVRAHAQGRWMLMFESGTVQVDMEVIEDHGRLRLIGQISGAAGEGVHLESVGERRPIEVDGLGRFMVDDLTPGRVRLHCRSSDGTRVVTAWVRI